MIPPEGGSFRYDLDLVNEGNTTRAIDVWVTLTGPDTSRIIERFSRTLDPGDSLHRTFRQRVRGTTLAGTYSVTGNAGTFPTVEVSDSFTFEKR